MDKTSFNMTLKNRTEMTCDGVMSILGLDENYLRLEINEGQIEILGKCLKIETMSKETGKIVIVGEIDAFEFKENKKKLKK